MECKIGLWALRHFQKPWMISWSFLIISWSPVVFEHGMRVKRKKNVSSTPTRHTQQQTQCPQKIQPTAQPSPPTTTNAFPFLKGRLTQKVTDFCSMISLQLNDITKFFVLYNGTIALQIFTHCFTYLF